MTRDEIVSLIQMRLGFRTDLADEIVAELKLAQVEMERAPELPWFLVTEMSNVVGTADEERLGLPSDFLREYEYGYLWLYDSADSDDPWKELAKDDYGALKAAKTGTGEPTHYALRGAYLTLHPTPNAAYAFKQVYFAADVVLSTNVENNWTKYAPDVIMNKAGLRVARGLKDTAALTEFTAEYAAARERMYVETIARHETGTSTNMGDD